MAFCTHLHVRMKNQALEKHMHDSRPVAPMVSRQNGFDKPRLLGKRCRCLSEWLQNSDMRSNTHEALVPVALHLGYTSEHFATWSTLLSILQESWLLLVLS